MSTQGPSKIRLRQQNITPSQVQALRGLELHYDISYQAIICITCGFALKTDDDRVGRHLKEKHGIPKKRRGKLNTLVNSLHLPDPDELPKRPDRSVQHPFLALQTGAECKHCVLRSTSHDILSRHLKKVHTQEINGRGTKGKRWLRDHIWDNLTFQSWKANDIQSSWIVVIKDDQQSLQKGPDRFLQAVPDTIKEFAEKLVSEEHGRLDEQPCTSNFDGTLGKKELLTNCMRRTRWDETLSQARRDMLVTLSEVPLTTGQPFWIGVHGGERICSPVKHERKLALIVQALDRLFDRCADTVLHTDVILQLPNSIVPYVIGRGLSVPQREMLEQLWSDRIWEDQPPTSLVYIEEYGEDEIEEEGEEEDNSENEGGSDYEDSSNIKDAEDKIYAWPEQESSCFDE
ncbi:hypothetical protein FOXG_22007 [Fusarium oxysporum f. sp. lycopersici 4287]|uniref:Uncharacterized protein n=2 Tax=Fusarium oxysporum f. sp. lycopersici (strain 4287 / CBS 123668 / FGSC 9935 / NRRL 34936) TaxID=426428 RepID=A0A0J9W3P5_FUSO4|nr:hypothetical protein FOXG_22007 [Fusarium oxysporum f. sp. lycopersici 4287]KNB17684.1 hypothetical protein FOXG_22007 [Fusarium oxysporum f. sp. lycopersici 4287]